MVLCLYLEKESNIVIFACTSEVSFLYDFIATKLFGFEKHILETDICVLKIPGNYYLIQDRLINTGVIKEDLIHYLKLFNKFSSLYLASKNINDTHLPLQHEINAIIHSELSNLCITEANSPMLSKLAVAYELSFYDTVKLYKFIFNERKNLSKSIMESINESIHKRQSD